MLALTRKTLSRNKRNYWVLNYRYVGLHECVNDASEEEETGSKNVRHGGGVLRKRKKNE